MYTDSVRSSDRYHALRKAYLEYVIETQKTLHAPKQGSFQAYDEVLSEFTELRGRELYYPYLAAGFGNGPFVELLDGSVKYDMITGIGVHFFGHAHPELIVERFDGLLADTMQGNLQPGVEIYAFLKTLLSATGFKHGWLACSGTMANDMALKLIRQKHAPRTAIFAFDECFAGRSVAMQEVTDSAAYRQGQPLYGEVCHLPFYDPSLGVEKSLAQVVSRMRHELKRYPDRFCGVMLELVQGEGGCRYAPKEFYQRFVAEARASGLAVWVDEVQTFGRTGSLLACQEFGVTADIVTVGKLLQGCAVLYTADYNPKAGLISGTFAGSTSALRAGRRVVEMLLNGDFLGPQGKIARLAARFRMHYERFLQQGLISEIRIYGGFIACAPCPATEAHVKLLLKKLFEEHVVAFSAGHDPYFIRMLPPFGIMTEVQVDDVCMRLERVLEGAIA